MRFILFALALLMCKGCVSATGNNCTFTSSTCDFSNVTAVFRDFFTLQNYNYACAQSSPFYSCLNSLQQTCLQPNQQLTEYMSYALSLNYLCSSQVKDAVSNNSQCMGTLNFTALNESCAWTYAANSDYCVAENMHIDCMYNATVRQCGPVVGKMVSVVEIQIATYQLSLHPNYCQFTNNQAPSCLPADISSVCDYSNMNSASSILSLQNLTYMCNNSTSYVTCVDDFKCLPVDEKYSDFLRLQSLASVAQYACSDSSSTVIRNNIGCYSTINLTNSNQQLMNCVSSLDYSSVCSYLIPYLQCINVSVQQQCGVEVANVYTNLAILNSDLTSSLNTCSHTTVVNATTTGNSMTMPTATATPPSMTTASSGATVKMTATTGAASTLSTASSSKNTGGTAMIVTTGSGSQPTTVALSSSSTTTTTTTTATTTSTPTTTTTTNTNTPTTIAVINAIAKSSSGSTLVNQPLLCLLTITLMFASGIW